LGPFFVFLFLYPRGYWRCRQYSWVLILGSTFIHREKKVKFTVMLIHFELLNVFVVAYRNLSKNDNIPSTSEFNCGKKNYDIHMWMRAILIDWCFGPH
jgi:hypothetical protein